MRDEPTPSYPPPRHLLRDLRIVIERDDRGIVGSLEIVPEMLDAAGRLRIGVLATLVDVVAGEASIRAVSPDWVATSDLSLDVALLPAAGRVEAIPRVIRQGRQTVVLEVALREPDTGSDLGLATLGFAILAARSDVQKSAHWAETPAPRSEFALPDSGLRKPILEAIGVGFDPARPGLARLAVRPDLVNSLGAIQGGGMAILLEATAEDLARAQLGEPVHVHSLGIHYLKLARVGPVRAEARRLARTAAGVLLRVELFDEGRDDELLTVASVGLDAGRPGASRPGADEPDGDALAC